VADAFDWPSEIVANVIMAASFVVRQSKMSLAFRR
jgi:hypothetical protein